MAKPWKKMTNKQKYNFYKKKERHWFEAYLDCHNRKFELIRTLAGLMTVVINIFIFLRVFGKI